MQQPLQDSTGREDEGTMGHTDSESAPDDICVHCKRRLIYGVVVKGEWAHMSGSRYCQTPNGYTATPLREATPTYYGPEDVL